MATGVAFEDLQEVIAETKPPSLVSSSTATISSLAKECVKRYDALCTTLRETTSETATAHGFVRDDVFIRIQDARPRFKAWATNIAALQEGHLKSSLDFRLREAVEIRSRVLKILESLKESLNEAELIVTGVRGNKTWEVGAMSDSSFNSDFGSEFSSEESDTGSVNERLETSELDELLSAIKMANSSLMDISIVIRNTPTRDDYAKAAARYSLDSHWDISHVDAKFGSAKRSSDWLIQRLGKSITRRRQYLTYRKNHHDKLSKDWDEPPKEVVVLEEEEKAPQTLALTKATTYVEALPAPPKDGSEVGSFETETSYQQTVAGETEDHILTVPPPPAEAFEGVPFEFGHPFQCPYCWTEQNVKGRNAWKKHVFRDLRPYVCTFKECNLRMFRSRNEWFAHELQAHRREWTCATCSKLFSSKSSFKSHLVWHNPAVAGSELDALILQSEEPMDRFPASACSFCDEWEDQIMNPNQNEKRAFLNDGKDVAPYGTKTQFRRHLGRHMEQLALFALPRDNLDDVEDDSDREIRGEVIGDDSDASTGTTASMNVGESTSTEEYFHDEINRIRKELPGVKIEASEMGAGGRTYYASLVGPWGANDTTVPIEVTVVFAERDLDFNVPKFGLHSAHILTDDYLLMKNQVCEIADSFAARPRDCVKGVLTYLLGEAEFVNGSLISKKDILASNNDPSAKDFADHWIGPETLEEEISHFQKARPEVTFDKIDLVQRNVTITLLSVCLEIDFPEAYPKSETPTFTVSVPASSSRSLPDDASTIIIRAMIEIAEMCLARHRGCFENVFTYILSVMGGADPNNRIILKEEGKASIGSVPGETSGASGDDEQSLTSVQASEDSNAIEVQVGPEFWQEEVSHVRTRLPQIDLDVDLMTNSVCAVLDEPRDDDGIAHHIKLYIYFPSGYPISKAPAFTFGSIWGFHLETGELGREMTNIAEACLARKQGCLEAVLTYLGVKMDPPLRNPKEQVDIESDSEILDKIETGLAPESETYLKCCQCGEPVPPSAYMEKNCSSCAHRCCVRCIRKVETATDAHPEGTSSDLQEESLAGDEDLISAAHQAGKDDTMTERSDMDHFDQDSELNIIEQHHKIGMPSKGITSENTTTIRIIFYTAPLTGHDLLTLFRPYGQILGVRVPDKARFAYMKFVHREDAERAIKEMDKYLVNGHSLDVDFATTSWTEKLEESDDSDPIPGDATALANPLSPELQTTVDRVIEGREMSDEDWAKWAQDPSRKNIPITSKQPTAETSDQLPGDQSSKETPVVPIVQKRYVQELTVDTPEDAILDPEASMQAIEEDDMAQYAGQWRAENAPSRAELGIESLVPDTQVDIADKAPSPPLVDRVAVAEMLKMQMEYYFSEGNLPVPLRKHMDEQGFVSLDFIANFERIGFMTSDIDTLRSICEDSDVIEFAMASDGKYRVRRKEGWKRWVLPKEDRVEDLQVDRFSSALVTEDQREKGRSESIDSSREFDQPSDFDIEAARQSFIGIKHDAPIGKALEELRGLANIDKTEEAQSIKSHEQSDDELERQRIQEIDEESEGLAAAQKVPIIDFTSIGETSRTHLSAKTQSYVFKALQQQAGTLTGWRTQVMPNERMGLIFHLIGNLRFAYQHSSKPPTLQNMIDIGISVEKKIFDTSPNKERYKTQIRLKLEQLLEARAENQSSVAVDVEGTLAQSQSNAQRNSETNVKDPVAWAARLEEYKEIFRDSLRKEESLAVESYESLLKSIGLVLDVSHQERMYRRIADDRVAAVNKYEAVSQSALASAAAAPDRINWEETLEIAMKSQVLRFRTSQARFRVQTVGAYEVSGVADDARTESRASVKELGQDLQDDTTQSQPPADISRDGVAYNPEELVLPVETILDQSEEDIKILEKAIDKEIRVSMTRHRPMLLQDELLGFEQMGENWTRRVEELKGEAVETYRSMHTSYRDSESNTVTGRNRRRDAVLQNFVSTLKLEEVKLGLALRDLEPSRQKSKNSGFRDDSMRAAAKSEVEDEEEEVEEKEEEEEGDLYEEQQQRINPIGDIGKPAGSLSRDFAEANEVPGIKESGLELLRGDRLTEENNERHLRRPELQTAGNNPALGQVTAQTTSESHGNIENADPEEYDPEKYVDQRLRKLREIYKKLEFYRQLSDPAQQAEFLGQQEPAVAREMKDKIELARQLDLERHASLRGPTVNIEKSEADDNLESDNQEKISPAHSLSSLRTVPEGAGVDWQAGGETLRSSTSVEAERQVVESRETGMRETGTVVPIGEDDMEVYRLRDRSLHGKEADQDGEEQSVEYAQAGSSNKRRAALPPGSDHGSTHDINMSRTKAGDGVDISNSDEPRTSSYSSIKNTLDWESIKEPFFKLYVQEDRPLQEVQAILKETHGFNASERMFKAHIRYWNFDRGKVIREMARSLEAQQVLPSVANNYNFQPAPRSLAEVIEKQPSDQRSEDIASPAAERNPQTSTTEAEDITAWKIRLEADRTYWFEAFDVEIDIAREAMMRDGILGSKRDGFALTRLQAWQKAADELRTKAHKTYSAAHDSALEAGRESTLTDADKRGWQARLWDVADRVQMLSLKDGLTALAAEVAELKSKEDGAEEMENEATQESQTRAESTEGKGLALTNESSTTRSVGSSSPLEPSEDQFQKESPWANPQHPSYKNLPDGQTLANQYQRTPSPVPQVMVQPQQGQHRQGLSPPTAGLKEVRQDIPPCNTLTVGNLPRDASEDELKAIFTRQRGYKRMLFRTKETGPMCYVEFEDIPSATEALHTLNGHPLHNSIHGGIELWYSRSPLGRRSHEAAADATERWLETAETSRVPARFEAGRASSDFISREEFDRAASEDTEHVTKTAADLIKSAAT